MVILAGPPGSGKTSLAKTLERDGFGRYFNCSLLLAQVLVRSEDTKDAYRADQMVGLLDPVVPSQWPTPTGEQQKSPGLRNFPWNNWDLLSMEGKQRVERSWSTWFPIRLA